MLKKILTYGIVLIKLNQLRYFSHLRRYYDKRMLLLLLIPPAYLLASRVLKSPKKKLNRPMAASILGIAAGQLELMKLKAQAKLHK